MNASVGAPTCAVVSHNGFLNRRFSRLAREGRTVSEWAQKVLMCHREKLTHEVSYDLVEIPSVQFVREERSLLGVEFFGLHQHGLEYVPIEVPLLFLEQRQDRSRTGMYVFCMSVMCPEICTDVLFTINYDSRLNAQGLLGVERRNLGVLWPENTTFVFCAPP